MDAQSQERDRSTGLRGIAALIAGVLLVGGTVLLAAPGGRPAVAASAPARTGNDVPGTPARPFGPLPSEVVASESGTTLSNLLGGVSCATAASCVAVGSYTDTSGDEHTLVESWNGKAWSIPPSPDGAGSHNRLVSVSCPGPTDCVAVGSSNYLPVTLIESWNGATWSVVPSPNAAGSAANSLSGVSCSGPSSCVAVGTSATSESVTRTLIESWDGHAWTVVPSPDPGTPGSSFNGLADVSCAGPTSCVAVGTYGNISGSDPVPPTQPLIESWNGSAWSVVTAPAPGSSYSNLRSVSCTSSNSCVAVGGYGNLGSGTTHSLVESWNGATWSVVPSPDAPGGGETDLNRVSCASATACKAVGTYANTALSGTYLVYSTLVESWNGTAWSVEPSPNRGSYSNSLEGVACVQATSCFVVGYSDNASSYSQTLTESWDGTAWSIVPSLDVTALSPPVVGMAATPSGDGYWLVDSSGNVTVHGSAVNFGSMGGTDLNAPITHIVATPDGKGYWLVAADGGTFAFGDAPYLGSMGGRPLNAPVVDIAPTVDGKGYWLVAADGGVFSFGDAAFRGSMGGQPLNAPVVGMAAGGPSGGYWLVASDGGVFSFGAPFLGSTGAVSLNRPVLAMAATADGKGYWLSASDGGVFSFGDAAFRGSMGGQPLNAPVVGMAADDPSGGYWLVASDGGVFSFGAPFLGSG